MELDDNNNTKSKNREPCHMARIEGADSNLVANNTYYSDTVSPFLFIKINYFMLLMEMVTFLSKSLFTHMLLLFYLLTKEI